MRAWVLATAVGMLLANAVEAAPAPTTPKKGRRKHRPVTLPPLGVPAMGQPRQPVLSLEGTGLEKTCPATPLCRSVRKALVALWACSTHEVPSALEAEVLAARVKMKFDPVVLKTRYAIPAAGAAQQRFKEQLLGTNKQMARMIAYLEDVLEDLAAAGKKRDSEPAQWQANHDLVQAWVMARLTALDEQAVAVGMMRKDLPASDPTRHTAWQLVPRTRLADFANQKRWKVAAMLFERLRERSNATVWVYLAQQGLAAELGCSWEAVP
jgi:hypothetical protein